MRRLGQEKITIEVMQGNINQLNQHRKSANLEKSGNAAWKILPASFQKWWWYRDRFWPFPGWVRFGSLRRVTPISRDFGFLRGLPIDRYYIEKFLAANSADIHGRVLEIGDNSYTMRFGGSRVMQSDVLHVEEGNPAATIVGDLSNLPQISSETFDCVILTETIFLIYDFRAALRTAYRILKPGGALLVTFPGTSHQICRWEMDHWGDCWRFTTYSARKFFEEIFPAENVAVNCSGNVLSSIAFLHGIATEELTKEELDYQDQDYQLSISVRAVK